MHNVNQRKAWSTSLLVLATTASRHTNGGLDPHDASAESVASAAKMSVAVQDRAQGFVVLES